MTASKPIEGAGTIPRSSIYPNPNQPRKHFSTAEMANLAESIRENGILQPLLVRPKRSRYDGTPYQIIGGERRWRASEDILDELPVIIKDVDDVEAERLALIDNIQRVDLTPLEEAHAIRAMMEGQGLTIYQVTKTISKQRGEENEISQGWVNNRLALLRTGDDVKEVAAVRPNAMSALLLVDKVKEPETRAALLEEVTNNAPFTQIKARVDAHNSALEHQERVAKYSAPDAQTGERRQANERGESSSMSRGQRVTGPKRAEVRQEVQKALDALKAWAPLLNDADFKEMVEPVAREFLRGKLSR
ncbi:chromosome-partitioning protein Spo0J [Abditibacteriota bacterium]|nr:chromosome-partitioning protein Spo0J [Abditibacteriota bacterium]